MDSASLNGGMRSTRTSQLPVAGTRIAGAWLKYQQSTGKFIYRNPNFVDPRDGTSLHPTAQSVCDTIQLTDATVTATAGAFNVITSPSHAFVQADVGKFVNVDVPARVGHNIGTTIASISGTSAVLAQDVADASTTTLSSTLAVSPLTSLPVAALTNPMALGAQVWLVQGANSQAWTLSAAAPAGATSLAVQSQTPNFAYTSAATVTTVAIAAAVASSTVQTGSALSTVTATTSIPVTALTNPMLQGATVTTAQTDANGVLNTQKWVLTASALAGATSLKVQSQVATFGFSTAVVSTPALAGTTTVTFGTDDTVNLQTVLTDLASLPAQRVEIQGSMMVSTLTSHATGTVTAATGSTIYQQYGQTGKLIGKLPAPATINDVSFEKLRLIGDGNPLVKSNQWAIVLQPRDNNGARARVTDCYIANFCQSGIELNNFDQVEIRGNIIVNCATRTNMISVDLTEPIIPAVNWVIADNQVLSTSTSTSTGACIDVLFDVGQAPGSIGRVAITGNTLQCGSLSNFAGVVAETNGGTANVSITGNTILDCLSGISYGDSSGGVYQNSYLDLQNFTISGNTINCRSIPGAQGISGFASNVTITGNTVIAEIPFSLQGPIPNAARATNVTVTGNTLVASTQNTTRDPVKCSRVNNLLFSDNQVVFESALDYLTLTPVPMYMEGALSTGGPVTTLAVTATTGAIANGTSLSMVSGANSQTWVLTQAVNVGDTTINVASQTPNFAYPQGTPLGPAVTGSFRLKIIDAQGHNFGFTSAITIPATPAAVTTALQATLPAAINTSVIALSRGNAETTVMEVQYLNVLAHQNVALQGDFSGLTGATPTIARALPNAVGANGIHLLDTSLATLRGNKVFGAGTNGILVSDMRDGRIANNDIYEPSAQGATLGSGIVITGACGQAGVSVTNNEIHDRRVDATSTAAPLILYGVDSSGVTSGVVNSFLNAVTGTPGVKSNGSFTLLGNNANGMA